jgi:long-chain acyl-CoA synthetase
MILYTSGSTGTPKGVMTSFGAITRTGRGIAADTRRRVGSGDSRMLSYLPLAHSFERSWVEAASLVDGGTHLFFAESLDTFLADLQRARPTLFISVPRLWLKFQQGVFAKMPPAKLDRLLGIPILGGIVRKKVLKGLGLDAVKQAGSGSAPLAARADPLVPQARPAPVRGLRHERGQLLLAQLQRAVQRARLGRRADARRAVQASAPRARS